MYKKTLYEWVSRSKEQFLLYNNKKLKIKLNEPCNDAKQKMYDILSQYEFNYIIKIKTNKLDEPLLFDIFMSKYIALDIIEEQTHNNIIIFDIIPKNIFDQMVNYYNEASLILTHNEYLEIKFLLIENIKQINHKLEII